ncbi:anhydro-N-acetylmuramic acid kinase [Pollutimonas harenae]|uniref:Anhydro-N-acetylmuramic acid kinase n=1 Tax=Pollutimonas harenae TaxID=657015 RepID=A0A853H1M0_9BURK|nr:anhydro-N-acetylmuramic acid kinase [Pollutimonas harenae]NYT84054.1 anhydro-N-acetylmuramic acid kinase [Pollutimonas harenae]TEA73521.1 anhydro-N-acetylmuramic acid kinase [Pollutimonas harenae]
MSNTLYIGLMSGTSTDGVDAVLADFSTPRQPRILGSVSLPMPESLRQEFLALNIPGPNELNRAALAANALAELYAQACLELLSQADVGPGQVSAIGAHGQTVRHHPSAGYTIQLNAPALLVQRTGIPVIADFRSRDVAAGGQGAPLVPAFHHALFSGEQPRAILNLGGIANITLLDTAGGIRGFDTGPANVLLDLWVQAKTGRAYDANGDWAKTGNSNSALLAHLINSEPWFRQPPPKSTGRDLFNWDWLSQRLAQFETQKLSDQDIQATLQMLTASTVAQAIHEHAPDSAELIVCGGGAMNQGLMRDLQSLVKARVYSSSALNIPAQMVEALAFAWLAWAHDYGQAAGLPAVTGAGQATILGCKYPI